MLAEISILDVLYRGSFLHVNVVETRSEPAALAMGSRL